MEITGTNQKQYETNENRTTESYIQEHTRAETGMESYF